MTEAIHIKDVLPTTTDRISLIKETFNIIEPITDLLEKPSTRFSWSADFSTDEIHLGTQEFIYALVDICRRYRLRVEITLRLEDIIDNPQMGLIRTIDGEMSTKYEEVFLSVPEPEFRILVRRTRDRTTSRVHLLLKPSHLVVEHIDDMVE